MKNSSTTLSPVLVALVLGCLLPFAVLASSSSSGWTVATGSTSCSGDFTVSNVAFTCSDGSSSSSDSSSSSPCGFGSNVKVTGYLNAKTTLPEPARITVQGCVYSLFCKTVLDESNVDLCSGNVLIAQNGQTCPSSGLYRIYTSFDIPDTSGNSALSLLSGRTVTVHTTISSSSSSSTTCSFQATSSSSSSDDSSSSYQLSWGSVAVASLVLAAFGVYGIRRRRRRNMAQIDLYDAQCRDGGDGTPSANFELMANNTQTTTTDNDVYINHNHNNNIPHVSMA